MDTQTKAAILAIVLVVPISAVYVWNSEQSFVLAETDSSEITVITSFYPLYEFTKQVGQDKVNVSILIPPGIEPHDWEPTISDLQKMHNADLIVINGIGFENWIDDIDTVNSDVIVVDTSNGISVIHYDVLEGSSDQKEYFSGDPHIWLNPMMAKKQIQNIVDALVLIDPQNEKFYKQNAQSYQNKLDLLDSKIKSELSSCKKDFIAFHNAFSYFSQEYGLNQHSIVDSNEPNIGPTPKTLEAVINLAKTYDVNVIFSEESIDTRSSQVIANEVNARVLILSPIEIIDKNSDYVLKMENNLSNLKEALCN
ncbi:MAG TPA: zinc ABC transporter substrate-binding protein [Nitrosopumilaceae archaeon]|nr:zinc ABC transporter substrate-binding protein [Nitrosopumilaceae archaeon]